MSLRRVFFANTFERLVGAGAFVLNPCDAQGWDYPGISADLARVPVFQFSRTSKQRDTVALMPLDDPFMGPGSSSIPPPGYDSTPFREKRPSVVWRGRMSGTIQARDRIDWLEGEFRKALVRAPDIEDEAVVSIMRYARPRIIERLAPESWANVGAAILPMERKLLRGQRIPEALRPLFRQPLSREEQLASRYVLSIEGNDYPTGLYWGLQSNSLVLRAGNLWETALDFGLRPWEHFVPVAADGSDIEAVFRKCEADPEMCETIIANAHRAIAWLSDREVREAIDRATLARYVRALAEGRGKIAIQSDGTE